MTTGFTLGRSNFVVAGGQPLVAVAQGGLAVGAADRARDHGLVGAGTSARPPPLRPRLPLRGPSRLGLSEWIGLLALRGRYRGIVRRLRRLAQLGFQFRHSRRQRPHLRPERANQRVLLVVRQMVEVGEFDHTKLESGRRDHINRLSTHSLTPSQSYHAEGDQQLQSLFLSWLLM